MAHKLYNWYWRLYEPSNILRATNNTIRGKGTRHDVQHMMEHIGYIETMQIIWELLESESFIPSPYKEKVINDGKERHLKIAPLIPDRIVHHCIVDVLEEELRKLYIHNTYACIKGRGIHACLHDLTKALRKDKAGTRYCLKIDIRHYYDNISHEVLKRIMAHSIGDKKLLRLLYMLVDSTDGDKGIPIGYLTSQHFANWYLTPFDHWIKEVQRVRYYFRYMDDIVILAKTKTELHELLEAMRKYLGEELELEIKPNWQIFPVDARSIDFVGYKSNHYVTLARASILKTYWHKLHKLERKYRERGGISYEQAMMELASNQGWLQHCTEIHYRVIMQRTYEQLFNYNIMAQSILNIGLISDSVQPTFDNIDRVKGTTLYNFQQQWIEVEEEHDGKKVKVKKNQYNSLLVQYPLTRKHVFETLITAKYPANTESKLLNDYNAAMAGIEDESKKQPYLDFLADRKQLHAMVEADCKSNNVPEE